MKNKFLKKKYFKWLLFSFLVFVAGLSILVQFSIFQTFIAKSIVNAYLSEKKEWINFDKLYFSPFSGLNIEELIVFEQGGQDTLLYIETLNVDIDDLNLKEKHVVLDDLTLENPVYYLKSTDTTGNTNMQWVLDLFPSDTSSTDSSGIFKLDVDNIEINNVHFKYQSIDKGQSDGGINFSDLEVFSFNFKAENYRLVNDSMSVDIESIDLKEKSGFVLNNFNGSAIVAPSEISVKHMVIKTLQTHLFATNYSMKYGEWSNLGDFIDKVKLDIDMSLSTIHPNDIAYFAPVLRSYPLPFFTRGRIYGKINRLKSKNLKILVGRKSSIETDFSLDGLPDINETFLSLNLKQLKIYYTDFKEILATQDSTLIKKLPAFFSKIDYINFEGNTTGFLTDLVTYGTFYSSLGTIKTDLHFKLNSSSSKTFSGKIETQQLDLSLLNEKDTIFGKLSLKGKMFANIDSSGNIDGTYNGNISKVEIYKYPYSNIDLDAKYQNNILSSNLNVNDTNIVLHLNSTIDFKNPELIGARIDGEIKKLHFNPLGFIKDSIDRKLSMSIAADIKNASMTEFDGNVKLLNIDYKQNDLTILTDQIEITSLIENNLRNIQIHSDLFDLSLIGQYQLKYAPEWFDFIQHQYLPSLSRFEKKSAYQSQSFNFDILLKKTNQLFNVVSPEYYPSEGTKITGNFNNENALLSIDIKSDTIYLSDLKLSKVNIELNGEEKELNNELTINEVISGKDVLLRDFFLNNLIHKDSINTYLTWSDAISNEIEAEILSESYLNTSNYDSLSIDINMIPSYMTIEDSIWFINDAKFRIRGSHFFAQKFILNHDSQYAYVNGSWNTHKNDTMSVILSQINLEYFPIIDRIMGLDFEGTVNGNLKLSTINDQSIIFGYIRTDTLCINDRELGNLMLSMNFEPLSQKMEIDISNKAGKKNFETIAGKGTFDFKQNNANLDIQINKQKINFFEPFVEEYISEIRGYADGKINISGPLNQLNYQGKISFLSSSMKIKYLGVKYSFNGDVEIKKDAFVFNGLKILEDNNKGDYADLFGNISYHHFEDFIFDLKLNMNSFMVLNTSSIDNELYYGSAFLSGLTEITGNIQNLNIKVSAKTERDTKFFIPLNTSEEASSNNFISFVHKGTNTTVEEDYKADLSGLGLNFELTVTPDAEVMLIFDDQLGDIVKANGSGNLDLNINTLGQFTILGDYNIEKGEYLFTLQNVINKRFKIENGSTIKWNGDPYQAYIDLNAVYRLKTPIYDLTHNDEDKERIPVECHLLMKNSLLNPEITFDIKTPSANDQVKTLINAMDEDEKNKQMLSLLVLNSFSTPDYLKGGEEVGSGNAVGKNAGELLSNQLSNWLSSISDDFDIGVNYRPGDEITSNELEVALSTQLFNDRVSIDGNVGLGKYQNTNSNVIGNVSVDVKINKKGNVRIRGFNRANENEIESVSLYTQGVGLYYREDFDSFGELLTKYWKKATFQGYTPPE
ncbi:MAG: translocation/assembly module TamB [Bacteroidales bacterium]|nr:translocation/assembly module TamB [Bacteroidales bacterium]